MPTESLPTALANLPSWMRYERFFGLDIHKQYITVVAINREGEVILQVRRVPTIEWPQWAAKNLGHTDAVVLESTTNAWTVFGQTVDHVGRCVVAHPDRKRRVKTDIQDAKGWAERLLVNDIKEVWVPPQHVRDLRGLISYRIRQITVRVRLKNRLQSIVHSNQLIPPEGALFAAKNRVWWKNLALSQIERFRVQQDLASLDLIELQIKEIDHKLAGFSQDEQWREEFPYLMQLPGVGLIVGMTVLGAIGDISRFESPQQLVGYSGLGASIEQSGDKHRNGGITKTGRKDLRFVMVEAARVAVRQNGRWKKQYERLEPRIGSNKAVVAVARKMLVVIWHLLTKKVVDQFANPDLVAGKIMKLAWQLTEEQRGGMKLKEFIRYYLTILGLGKHVKKLFRGGRNRPIATLEELIARFPELTDLPEFEAALAEP